MKCTLFCLLILLVNVGSAQTGNPNLADPGSGCSVEQATSNQPLAYKAITGNTEEGWNSAGGTAGASITLTYAREVSVKEIWILPKPIFSHVITPYNLQYRYSYARPKNITITFSDGTSSDVLLRQADDFQIIPLAKEQRTGSITITVRDVWQEEGAVGTGIGKVRVFAQPNALTFTMRSMENYNAVGDKPVKRALLNVVNPGPALHDAHVTISQRGKVLDAIALGTIEARAVTGKEIWTFVPPADGDYDIALTVGGRTVATQPKLPMTAFRKTYFDGGKVLVHSTNHNDLGWLGTQFETADYRSQEIILPALKIMESAPDFKYTMEAVAYLREFVDRHPEKKEEIFRRTAERRFSWGAMYTLSLQEQVGAEKLARQFYFGRRWIKENIPGADSRIYINADVPMLTWQLPQILRSAGVEYLVQARIPLGFYHWQGLDGTTVPVYGLRYGNSPRISPGANEEWLNLVYGREEFARSRNLPKTMIYDYNEDYLPPNGELVPFVKAQNAMMSAFAVAWNKQHAGDVAAQVRPPLLEFTNPEDMLKGIFSTPGMHLQTLRGQ